MRVAAILLALFVSSPAVAQPLAAPAEAAVRDTTQARALTSPKSEQAASQEVPRPKPGIRFSLMTAVGYAGIPHLAHNQEPGTSNLGPSLNPDLEFGVALSFRLTGSLWLANELAYAYRLTQLGGYANDYIPELPPIIGGYPDGGDYFTFHTLEYRPTLQWGRGAYLLGGADIGSIRSANLHSEGNSRSVLTSVNRGPFGWHAGIGLRKWTRSGTLLSFELWRTQMTTDVFTHWPRSLHSWTLRLGYAPGRHHPVALREDFRADASGCPKLAPFQTGSHTAGKLR
jgi:hypothetical protein